MSRNKDRLGTGTPPTDNSPPPQLLQQETQGFSFVVPTEFVELPSGGRYYPEGHPLHGAESIEIKQMTAKEEDILTSANLIRKGTVLDKLFQSLIVSPINYNDLLIGDKNAVMIAARILGYGKNYSFELTCPECGTKNNVDTDLTELGNSDFDEDVLSDQGENGYIEWELPNSKRKITFKIPTHQIEEKVRKEMDARRKMSKNGVDPEITTRFKHMILSVDGNDEKKYITNFVDNEFLSRDSFEFRKYLGTIQPDVKFNIETSCPECDFTGEAALTIDAGFFWPQS